MQRKTGLFFAMVLAVVLGATVQAADVNKHVAEIIGKMPAENAKQEHQLCAGLIKLGPEAVTALCKQLVPPGKGDDTKARLAISSLAAYATGPAGCSARTMIAGQIVKAMQAARDAEVKAFLIRRLEMVGEASHLAALAPLLTDERLGQPAATAMLAIGGPQVPPMLAEALPKVPPANHVALLNAAARSGAKAARQAVLGYLKSDDPAVKGAALHALSSSGTIDDLAVLAEASKAEAKPQRDRATAYYLAMLRRLAPRHSERVAAACLEIMKTRKGPEQAFVRCAALQLRVDILGVKALDNVIAATKMNCRPCQHTAMKLALTMKGSDVTRRWVEVIPTVKPDVQARIVRMLGRRGDKTAGPAIRKHLTADAVVVRHAAVRAAGDLMKAGAVPLLLDRLREAPADDVAAVRQTLLRLPTQAVVGAAAKALPDAPAPMKVALIEIFAARRATQHADLVFKQATATHGTVRLAALRALGKLADAGDWSRLTDLLFAAKGKEEQAAARDALVEVLSHSVGAKKRLQALLNRARKEDDASKASLALDAYLRVIEQSSHMGFNGKSTLAEAAIHVMRRPEDVRRILRTLAEVPTETALELAASRLERDEVAAAAADAVIQIVCPPKKGQPGMTSEKALSALTEAVKLTKDPKLRARAESYLGSLPRSDKDNLARGKPVKTSVPQQGDRAPELAVNGKCTDRRDAWFGDRWPAWLQVDLGKVHTIDCVHVYFYWDGRYYQYTVQTSLDGKTFKTVVDMSKNTLPANENGRVHGFAPAEARYVRINVLKNSVNEAVHLTELKIYAKGTGPKPPPPPAPPKPDAEGFIPIFNGKDLTGWVGHTRAYRIENGVLIGGGNLFYSLREFGDFILRFEFKLVPGANSGIAIRTPLMGRASYQGMEIQVLDDTAPKYKNLRPYQYHGSIYGVVPAKRGHQKPVGEWNTEEIIAKGRHVKVVLNGVTIVDANIDEASKNGTMDHKSHPGLKRSKGYIGICGHGSPVSYRNVRVKPLD